MELVQVDEEVITKVVNAAFRVHKELGPGLLESVYERALLLELTINGVKCANQVEIPVIYRDEDLGIGFRADILIENSLLIEIKAVEKLLNVHTAQIMTYLKLLRIKRGLLINFNVDLIKNGIKRVSI